MTRYASERTDSPEDFYESAEEAFDRREEERRALRDAEPEEIMIDGQHYASAAPLAPLPQDGCQ